MQGEIEYSGIFMRVWGGGGGGGGGGGWTNSSRHHHMFGIYNFVHCVIIWLRGYTA